jgi:hypothetical protein
MNALAENTAVERVAVDAALTVGSRAKKSQQKYQKGRLNSRTGGRPRTDPRYRRECVAGRF